MTDATVVMSQIRGRSPGRRAYGVDRSRVHVIPHGVPELPFVDPITVKPALGVEDRQVILSFGLLGPGKGYELALAALPDVVAAHPAVLYVIVGATHPDLVRSAGRGLPREPRRQRRPAGARGPCPVRRSVRRAGRADEVARGGRRLRHALSQPRPDRVRDHVVRDGRRPRDRVDAVRLRQRAPRRRPRRPRAARVPGRARGGAQRAPRAIPPCGRRSAAGPTPTAVGWSGRPSGPSIAISSRPSPAPKRCDAVPRPLRTAVGV